MEGQFFEPHQSTNYSGSSDLPECYPESLFAWHGERLPFGTALGVLYSVTTISGPPLAILFNNQGLVKTEFRAGLALVRVAEIIGRTGL
jgi:hypothetical protein